MQRAQFTFSLGTKGEIKYAFQKEKFLHIYMVCIYDRENINLGTQKCLGLISIVSLFTCSLWTLLVMEAVLNGNLSKCK